ncbi:MAG: hypothetical protein FJY20_00420 [Bacteroidetes bacterium]|nr:hypothetical protein [Bacteroidota bacterium]
MKRIKNFVVVVILFITAGIAKAQQVDSIKFFTDEQPVELTLTTDIRGLQNESDQDVFQPATAKMKFPDGTEIEEPVQVGARGKFRRGYCRIPPIMMQFRNASSPRFASLGKLKLVIACGAATADEELLLKEFLVYKIYNQLTDMSFRVRLMKTTYNDSRGKIKSFTQYAFMLEDDGDMARRNGCKKRTHGQVLTESTDRATMTMVAIFEYMIGNTDWSVPNDHNIELIFSRENPALLPFSVPYDFDYCGLVDASYAIPNEIIGTEKVTERVYRGFPRKMDELQTVLDAFRAKKETIRSLVKNFTLLGERVRNNMIRYLDDFFQMIENRSEVKSVFIDNARSS